MAAEQTPGNMGSEQMLAEQLALLKSLEAAQKSGLHQQESAAENQAEMIATLYKFMRVTVDIQEVMIQRLNVISFASVALVILSLIGVFALLTR